MYARSADLVHTAKVKAENVEPTRYSLFILSRELIENKEGNDGQ